MRVARATAPLLAALLAAAHAGFAAAAASANRSSHGEDAERAHHLAESPEDEPENPKKDHSAKHHGTKKREAPAKNVSDKSKEGVDKTTTRTITRTVTTTSTRTTTTHTTTTSRTTTTRTTTTRTTSSTTSHSTTTTTTHTSTSTTKTHTTTTTSTTTITHTSTTTSSSTSTTSSTTTSTSTTTTTRPHVFGGKVTRDAFEEWLKVWRGMYINATPCGTVACLIPEMDEALMPRELHGVRSKVLVSEGGVASGVVTEGMGYAIMIEGFLAVEGREESLELGLGLMKSWLGMTYGPRGCGNPRGGGSWSSPLKHTPEAVLKVDSGKYGVSAIEASKSTGLGPAGLPSWKYPLDQCEGDWGCIGSATDGDEDAVLGMIYLTSALGYPQDMVDLVMRTLIAFASADLGFPDLYRTLPSGERVYVPKGGSDWGGLLPEKGKFKTTQEPWCYSPSYFAPAHYRAFRDFAGQSWLPYFDEYLPPRSDGTKTTVLDLTAAFDGAISAGYNLLYHSSCESGAVSNWVGVKTECDDPGDLNCDGVPWANTPYVGAEQGTCSASGTEWGSYGADASRAAWRIAMDYTLYKDESDQVQIYDKRGHADKDAAFSANIFLNRIVRQYVDNSKCNGAVTGDCFAGPGASPWKIAAAFDWEAKPPPEITCDSVPNKQASWWASYMAYPTFTAFVAPFPDLIPEESSAWMDTFSSICDWTSEERVGLCATTYFEASQSIIATMIMAKVMRPFLLPPEPETQNEETLVKDKGKASPRWQEELKGFADAANGKKRSRATDQDNTFDVEVLQHKDEVILQTPQKHSELHAGLGATVSARRVFEMLALTCALLTGGVFVSCARRSGRGAVVFPRAEAETSEDGERLLSGRGARARSPRPAGGRDAS